MFSRVGDGIVGGEFPGGIGSPHRWKRAAPDGDAAEPHIPLVVRAICLRERAMVRASSNCRNLAGEHAEEVLFVALVRRQFRPGGEPGLRLAVVALRLGMSSNGRRPASASDVARDIATGDEGNLVAEIRELVVHRVAEAGALLVRMPALMMSSIRR